MNVAACNATNISTNTTIDNDESVAPDIEGEVTNTNDIAADAPMAMTDVTAFTNSCGGSWRDAAALQSVPMHVSIIYHTQYEVVVLDTTNLAPYTSFYLPYKQALPVPVHMH